MGASMDVMVVALMKVIDDVLKQKTHKEKNVTKRKQTKKRNRLKPLKAKLTGKSGNIPDATNLLDYVTNAVDPKVIGISDQEKDMKSIFSQKRALKDYVTPFSKRYKLKGLVKGRFEAKLHAIEFLLGQSEKDLNETTDTAVANLTDLLILVFKKGRASKK